jgi:hypothetical protein
MKITLNNARHPASLAAEMAVPVDAGLTLVHITASVEMYGPGGLYVNPEWKQTIVGIAKKADVLVIGYTFPGAAIRGTMAMAMESFVSRRSRF